MYIIFALGGPKLIPASYCSLHLSLYGMRAAWLQTVRPHPLSRTGPVGDNKLLLLVGTATAVCFGIARRPDVARGIYRQRACMIVVHSL